MNQIIFVLKAKSETFISELENHNDKYLTAQKDIELLCTWHLLYTKTLPSSYARMVVWDSAGFCYITIEELDVRYRDFREIITDLIRKIKESCLGEIPH